MDLLRRRNMMQGGGGIEPASDGKVWLYCTISNTESATTILNNISSFNKMSIDDGPDIAVSKTYTFDTEGEHLVKLTLVNPANVGGTSGSQQTLRGISIPQRIYFPSTVTSIGDQIAILRNASLEVHLPKSLTTIYGGNNFGYKSRAIFPEPIDLPNLTTWGSGVFNGSTISKIINLGKITNIANSCIRSIVGLTELHLPSTLTNLDDASIYSCSALKTVYCYATTPPTKNGNVFNGSSLNAIYVPAESVAAYKAASGWSSYASKIQAII